MAKRPVVARRQPAGVPYNDLSLILRDAARVEKFRDLRRNGPPVPVARDHNAEVLSARLAAHQTDAHADRRGLPR